MGGYEGCPLTVMPAAAAADAADIAPSALRMGSAEADALGSRFLTVVLAYFADFDD